MLCIPPLPGKIIRHFEVKSNTAASCNSSSMDFFLSVTIQPGPQTHIPLGVGTTRTESDTVAASTRRGSYAVYRFCLGGPE
jgi:hypothetical protein